MAATYEELMAKARELLAAGDRAGAKRVAEIAVSRRDNAAPSEPSGGDPTTPVFDERITEARKLLSGGDTAGGKRAAMDAVSQWGNAVLDGGPRPDLSVLAELGQGPQERDTSGGFMQTLKDNILGDDDPTTQNFGEKVGTFLNNAGESMTFGLIGDEAAAKVDSGLGRGTYDERLSHYRNQQQLFKETNPTASFLSVLAPAVLPGFGAAKLVGAASGLLGKAATGAVLGAGSGGLFGFMEGEGDNRASQAKIGAIIGGLLGGVTPAVSRAAGGAVRTVRDRRSAAAVMRGTDSVDDLITAAKKRYGDAERFGHIASSSDTSSLVSRLKATVQQEGLVTPKGRISKAYPKVRDALRMLEDFRGTTMTPTQMQQVRKLLQGSARSMDKSEARIGTKLLSEFSNWVEPLAPQFKEANALYARAMGGRMIDDAIELAGSRAGQFNGSGFENALRTEFRALERGIIKGNIKGVKPELSEAISKVARGGKVENFLRDLGKAAPTGIVSAGIGGGMPFLIGNHLGGPGFGFSLGAGIMAAGTLGRRAATAMQAKNAGIASAIARRGSPLPTAKTKAPDLATQAIMMGLIPALSGRGAPQ